MELLITLGRTLGFSLTSGVNLYATVAILGLAARYDWVALPPQFEVFANDWVIGGALLMYAIEFVADKIPWVDTVWDSIHTFVRPVGGALVLGPGALRPPEVGDARFRGNSGPGQHDHRLGGSQPAGDLLQPDAVGFSHAGHRRKRYPARRRRPEWPEGRRRRWPGG